MRSHRAATLLWLIASAHNGAAAPTNVVTSTQVTTANAHPASRAPAPAQPTFVDLGPANEGPLILDITTSGGRTSSDLLYGLMLEDLDHSIEGGLYAELVQNRAFQEGDLGSWYALGGASISLSSENPLSSALPNYLTIDISNVGQGFENTGYWGFYVQPVTYQVSIWAQSSQAKPSKITVALTTADGSTTWDSSDISISGTSWTQYTTTLNPSQTAPDNNNVLQITSADGNQATLSFGFISLFPPTYKNRPNGVRPDLMKNLIALNPQMCRVPGGNNMEGNSVADRWIWSNTVGPLIDRVGRQGDWGYYNTNGMGLLEWLQFCEDLGAETLLGTWAGYALGGVSVAEGSLQPYINAVLNELEYITGDSNTKFGALRAQNGRTEPFTLNYVEIGNEDWFSTTYDYRWPAFYNALTQAYPDITFVLTTVDSINAPAGSPWDMHYYGTASQMQSLHSAYDSWPRGNGTSVIVGEYSAQQYEDYTFPKWPWMQGTVGEAAFSIGIERNSDVVMSQMYAPFLNNIHYNQEERPRLITFDNDYPSTVLSTSYYMLQLFSNSHGAGYSILDTSANIDVNPLYWTASQDPSTNNVYVKLANAGASSQQVTLQGTDSTFQQASASILAGGQNDSNTDANPTNVQIANLPVSVNNGRIHFTLPAWSVAVVSING